MRRYTISALDFNALIAWVVVTIVFIVVIGFLYRRVSRVKKQEADERKDETSAY